MDENLKTKTAGAVICAMCKSWCYLALLSFVIFVLNALYRDMELINLILFLICQVQAFRLYIDKNLFEILYSEGTDEKNFDYALNFLLKVNKEPRSIESRWDGTRNIFKLCAAALICQFVLLCILQFCNG